MELRALVAFATASLAPAPGSVFVCDDEALAEELVRIGYAEPVTKEAPKPKAPKPKAKPKPESTKED